MIIGRKKELALLQKVYDSKQSEFVVVYGRRRIGKTFLIREFFSKQDCVYFQVTGMQKGKMSLQIKKFIETLSLVFFDEIPLIAPDSWDGAFDLLHKQVVKSDKKVVVFIDELPWMASKKSGLLETIDYYWNHYWSARNNIVLVICGSSASWIIKKIIQNKGGLHNRATCQMQLLPFSLSETEAFLHSRGIALNHQHILKLYMALGGVPHYLNYVEKGRTADEAIQAILFDQGAPLREEYTKLFTSLFNNAKIYMDLIKIIGGKHSGVTRSDIRQQLAAGLGGRLTERLHDLTTAGFIQELTPFGRSRGEYYKLSDEFCLFYLYWLETTGKKKLSADYWIKLSQTPQYHAWAGYSFEGICYKHGQKIIDALNIKTATVIDSWRFVSKTEQDQGAQVDLLIDRSDDAITLCEIKYTQAPFMLDKAEAEALKKKIQIFKDKTKTQKQIFLVFISANGLRETAYSNDMVSGRVILEDFFDPTTTSPQSNRLPTRQPFDD